MPTMPRLTDAELLRASAEALLGRDWRRPLAREIGVSGSLMARLATGRVALSPAMRARLFTYAAREAVDEVPRARRRVALLGALRDRFADKI